MTRSHPETWQDRLRIFYEDVDQDIASRGLACDGCGRCCRFDQVDHLLYASRLEREYLLAAAPLPEPPGDPDLLRLVQEGLRCPYQVDGLCTAREGRVLGCRLYFCRWPEGGDEDSFQENWHRRLKELHDDLGEEWTYGRLFPLRENYEERDKMY